jgi:glucokinase
VGPAGGGRRRRGPFGSGPLDRELNRLAAHPWVVSAARVASEFGLDPVALLADPDRLAWTVRAAAYRIIQTDRENARPRRR